MDRLPLLKALADDSRYAIFSELGRAPGALTTTEIAERLDLHPNTVRLHLERLRDVGLVEASTRGHGAVGRPQHHWALTTSSPSLGLEPSGWRLLARLLAEVAATGAAGPDALAAIGRTAGRERAGAAPGPDGRAPTAGDRPRRCRQRFVDELTALGFDPVVERVGPADEEGPDGGGPGGGGPDGGGPDGGGPDGGGAGAEITTVAFTSCPFRELATAFPDLVCALHHGLTRGIADVAGGEAGSAATVTAFATLVDADPCRAELTVAAG